MVDALTSETKQNEASIDVSADEEDIVVVPTDFNTSTTEAVAHKNALRFTSIGTHTNQFISIFDVGLCGNIKNTIQSINVKIVYDLDASTTSTSTKRRRVEVPSTKPATSVNTSIYQSDEDSSYHYHAAT